MIPLSRGLVTIVDDEDYALLAQFKWYALKSGDRFYATRHVRTGGTHRRIWMHSEIVGARKVDHRDGDGLNNTRANLRQCSHTENARNCKLAVNNTSGFKGVSFDRWTGRWRARIRAEGRMIFLGRYTTPEEAFAAYCNASAKYHGEFGRVR